MSIKSVTINRFLPFIIRYTVTVHKQTNKHRRSRKAATLADFGALYLYYKASYDFADRFKYKIVKNAHGFEFSSVQNVLRTESNQM